jgi:hypothetical protein
MQSIQAVSDVETYETACARVGATGRVLLFVVLWLASLAVPIACYNAAANQDAVVEVAR